MSTIVYRISVPLSVILVAVPVGTNLGRFWLLWALISGRFLLSQRAVFPARADEGLPAEAVRRSSATLAYGRWAIESLVQAWALSTCWGLTRYVILGVCTHQPQPPDTRITGFPLKSLAMPCGCTSAFV
jgi:hypothetical protein